MIDGGLDLAD